MTWIDSNQNWTQYQVSEVPVPVAVLVAVAESAAENAGGCDGGDVAGVYTVTVEKNTVSMESQ